MNTVINNKKTYYIDIVDDLYFKICDSEGNLLDEIDLMERARTDAYLGSDYVDGYIYYNDPDVYFAGRFAAYEEPPFESYTQFRYFCEDMVLMDYFKEGKVYRLFQNEDDADSYLQATWDTGTKVKTDKSDLTLVII